MVGKMGKVITVKCDFSFLSQIDISLMALVGLGVCTGNSYNLPITFSVAAARIVVSSLLMFCCMYFIAYTEQIETAFCQSRSYFFFFILFSWFHYVFL